MVEKVIKIENPSVCAITERINRFVVKVVVNEKPYRAYINNTGRLENYLLKGKIGFCTENEKTEKTDYRLFAVKEKSLGAVIDTYLQMKAFEKAAETKLIPWIKKCKILRRNVKLGKSLIDYLLECERETVYLEVKSAVLKEGEYAMYPDCPSSRGRRHIKELIDYTKNGGKGIILFIAALPYVRAFKPNKSADQELYELLREAYDSGVDIKSISLHYDPRDSFLYLSNTCLDICL